MVRALRQRAAVAHTRRDRRRPAPLRQHVTAARDAERAGRLTIALAHHRDPFALYRGEFLPGVVDGDIDHERLRLQTLAYNSGCRVGELLLAKGEPGEALRVVLDAISIDPYSERARRAEIRCHSALGSALATRRLA